MCVHSSGSVYAKRRVLSLVTIIFEKWLDAFILEVDLDSVLRRLVELICFFYDYKP